MSMPMQHDIFMNFYKNTALLGSKILQKYICRKLEDEQLIAFDEQQSSLFETDKKVLQFHSRNDIRNIISQTATNDYYIKFYESWEFEKLYKYSVPLFFEESEEKGLDEILDEKKLKVFKRDKFKPEYIINTDLKEASPIYFIREDKIFIKFVLQKSTITGNIEGIDYRYPIIIYLDKKMNCLEIRYDAVMFNPGINNFAFYEANVLECIRWLKDELGISLFTCNHASVIDNIKNDNNNAVKLYKQMMEMSSGGSAELTASEQTDYVLPFTDEIRELINENEELFKNAHEAKELLLQYLNEKEETANYPYIYVKWLNSVASQSYIVKITFDYFDRKFTVLQHITGSCRDLGMGRMNNAIQYLCQSNSFIKGEAI